MNKKIDPNIIEYLKLIIDLSDEIGVSKKEAKNLIDTALHFIKPKEINYNELKEEILSFIVINIFSLICK